MVRETLPAPVVPSIRSIGRPGGRSAPRLAPLALAGCTLLSSCRTAAEHRPPPPPGSAGAPELSGRGVFSSAGHDLRGAPRRFAHDTARVFSRPTNLYLLLGAGGYALFQEHAFEEREAVFFRNHTLYGTDIQTVLGALGNGLTLYGGALAWYVLSIEHGDERSYEDSKTLLSALTVTSVATLLSKATIPDGRPNGGSHDFPSGHASLSMAAAATLDGLYGHGVGWPAYLLSGMVGLQRLDIEKHDTGAVVFGWTLGFVVGRTLTADRPPEVLGLVVGPFLDAETGALGLSLSGGR